MAVEQVNCPSIISSWYTALNNILASGCRLHCFLFVLFGLCLCQVGQDEFVISLDTHVPGTGLPLVLLTRSSFSSFIFSMLSFCISTVLLALSASAAADPLHIPITRRSTAGPRDLDHYAAAAEHLRGKYGVPTLASRQLNAKRVIRQRASSADSSITNQVSIERVDCVHIVEFRGSTRKDTMLPSTPLWSTQVDRVMLVRRTRSKTSGQCGDLIPLMNLRRHARRPQLSSGLRMSFPPAEKRTKKTTAAN